jgi:D-beta-D-heptose 7-phosphate kinase/D-beta-D-heptose 1-phosphate adenosyltransferase
LPRHRAGDAAGHRLHDRHHEREGHSHSLSRFGFSFPTRAREVFDVTGAGDTVIATLAASLAGGLDAETAVTLANIAAGIVVAKTGTAPISRNELVAEFTASTQMKGPDKILDLPHLLVRLAEWRANGDRIVFTNGCFDILHVGHITLLEQCREFGDKVVIGLNSDASVKGLKGPTGRWSERRSGRVCWLPWARPTRSSFSMSPTPLELIRSLRPDVLVKGGDYTASTIVGADDVAHLGRPGRNCAHGHRRKHHQHHPQNDEAL